jgi:predicted Zn-dependent protease
MLESALGQALLAAGRSSDSMQVFERALAVAPRNVPLSLRQAEALLRLGKAREAHTLLLDLFNNVPPTPEQIRFTAFAASSAGDTGDAYYYMSEYHIGTGDLPLAVKQLELALEAPDLTSVQRARFEARQKEIREVLAQSGRRRDRRAADTM